MAVQHLVLMKLREALPERQLITLYRQCESHFDKIPGIVSSSMGANFQPGSSGFTHAVAIRFEDRNALDRFMDHPEHVAAGKLLLALFSEFLIFSYETDRE